MISTKALKGLKYKVFGEWYKEKTLIAEQLILIERSKSCKKLNAV